MRADHRLPADNNFLQLRLVLAVLVCLLHIGLLSGRPELQALAMLHWTATDVVVPAFFVISGFLITRSCECMTSLKAYAESRVRRILPAHTAVVLGSAAVLGALSVADRYFFTWDWWAYLAANLTFLNFLHPTLPGVFVDNPEQAINGALWTLKVEVAFYAVAPFVVAARRRIGWPLVLGTIYVLSCLYAAYVDGPLGRQLPAQMRFFAAGSAFYYLWPVLGSRLSTAGVLGALVFAASLVLPLGWIMPLGLAAVTLALSLAPSLFRIPGDSDLSFGLYILHFPIAQALVQLGAFEAAPWVAATAAMSMTLAGSVLLWRYVESPFIARRRRPISGAGSAPSLVRFGAAPEALRGDRGDTKVAG